MSFLRILSLFAMTILAVAAILAILICWIIDKPLYLDDLDTRIGRLEKKYNVEDN